VIRLLVADDEEFVRRGLRELLHSQASTWSIVGETASVTDAVRMVREAQPDIAIVDSQIPVGGARTLLRLLSPGETRVLVYSERTLEAEERSLLSLAGAREFVSKTAPFEEMPAALNRVAATFALATAVARPRSPRPVPTRLSGRQRQVAELLANGFRNRDIADRLRLSVRTVEAHRETVRRKLQIESVSQLARLFGDNLAEPGGDNSMKINIFGAEE